MEKRKEMKLDPIFLYAGRLAARAGKLSKKATHHIAKEVILLNIKKGYLAEKLLHTDLLYFRKFVEIKPESADVHYNLGAALLKKRRFNEAVFYFERAALLDFHYVLAYLGMAQAYRELGRYDQSIEALKRAITYYGKNAEVYYELGITYDTEGMYDEAIDSLKKAVELNPKFKKAQSALDSLLKSKGHKSKKSG